MAGYYGCRMSNNALQAYRDGEMPISKWDKATIMVEIKREASVGNLPLQCSMDNLGKLPEKALKELCLKCSSWHHTGMYYRKTNFYVLDADRIGGLTDQKLDEIAYEDAGTGTEGGKVEMCFPEMVWEKEPMESRKD